MITNKMIFSALFALTMLACRNETSAPVECLAACVQMSTAANCGDTGDGGGQDLDAGAADCLTKVRELEAECRAACGRPAR